jgi:hypothetical protein
MAGIELRFDFTANDKLIPLVQSFPTLAPKAASMALNQTMQRAGLQGARKAVYQQVAFPKGYLESGRLVPGKTASPTRLEASIIGRERPTSLARFAVSPIRFGPQPKGTTVDVRVKPGTIKIIPHAFFVRLRAGSQLTETVNNVGLAIRLKPGERIENRYKGNTQEIFPNVFLLYGPSVGQVLREGAGGFMPMLLELSSAEFFRQLDRLLNAW